MQIRVEKGLGTWLDVTVRHAGGPRRTSVWDQPFRQRTFITRFRTRCLMKCNGNGWGSKVMYQATQLGHRCKVALPESPPPPRQYCAGNCAPRLAIEVAWSAVGCGCTEKARGEYGGSERWGKPATCATARGHARAVCPP